ncbi:MAG: hypothetical protein ACYTEK_15095 [Planctomycetota bacterium]
MAALYKQTGDYTKAELSVNAAPEGHHLKLGDAHPHTKELLNSLIDLYETWSKLRTYRGHLKLRRILDLFL